VNCVQWLEETIIAYLLGGMAGLAFANIIVRRLFDGSIIWALELTLYLFLYLVVFGMSYVLRKGGHIGVDVMVKLMPATAQKWTEVSAGARSCCYAMFFSYTGWTVTSKFLSTEFLRTVGSDERDSPLAHLRYFGSRICVSGNRHILGNTRYRERPTDNNNGQP